MINIPTPVPAKKNKTRKPKSVEPPSPDLRQLVHEIFNQLTVMNLCCFKFRGAVGRTIDLTVLADVDRMEKAIADLTVLLENLPRPKTSALIECAPPDATRRRRSGTATADQRLSPIQAAFTRSLK